MVENLRKVKDTSLPRSSLVYEEIKKNIINGELLPDTPLVEESLAEQYKVSRTPIREALRKLEQDGLVEMVSRKGTYVKRLSLMDIEEIFIIREGLEGVSTRIATELISNHNLNMIEEKLVQSDKELENGNIETASKVGNELHEIILKIAGNNRILNIVSNLKDHIFRLHKLSIVIPGRLERSNKEHWEIFNAMKSRDGYLAEQKMREHIISTKKSLILAVKNDLNGI
jgi:DNA-binding GntR family transcriptional regulator